jgi:hypothetical protein
MITIEEYNKLPVDCIIRSGLISNSPTGCFMTRDENISLLKFVVVKRIEGWIIYFGLVDWDYEQIARNGDESISLNIIDKVFPCIPEIRELYIH